MTTEKLITDLGNGAMRQQDIIILTIMTECGLEGINMKDIIRKIGANGQEDWYYKDKAFLSMYPFEFKQVTDGRTTKLIATQRIEKLAFVYGGSNGGI
ncbi:MAG: hypothetical protein ABTQ25_08360 [Nitrosomonas ureae]